METIERNVNESANTISVRDLNIASYLLASGEVKLVKTERKDSRFVLFHFAPKDRAESLINNYYSDTNPLSPRNIFSAQRSLKDLIFSGGEL